MAEQTLQLHELQRRAGEGSWEQQPPSTLSGQAASGLAEPSPVPNLSAPTLCFFPSVKQACLFSGGKMRKTAAGD